MSAKLDSRLGRLGKPFIHFFLVGEQLLDARALLHGEEIKSGKSRVRLTPDLLPNSSSKLKQQNRALTLTTW